MTIPFKNCYLPPIMLTHVLYCVDWPLAFRRRTSCSYRIRVYQSLLHVRLAYRLRSRNGLQTTTSSFWQRYKIKILEDEMKPRTEGH